MNESYTLQVGSPTSEKVELTGAHLDAFHWLMHLADGTVSNFEIAARTDLTVCESKKSWSWTGTGLLDSY